MTIQIDYDRKEKLYKWVEPDTGQIFTAPAGAQNKAELWQTAVALFDPDLYAAAERIITKHPQLERVTWRAVELVINEAVEVYATPQGNVKAMVQSSDAYGRYAITNDNGYVSCQCQHFQNDAPMTSSGRQYCKHILAMHLWKVAKAPY